MRLLIPSIALLLGSFNHHLNAADVEVRMASGDLITGEVVSETSTTIELKRLVLVRHKPVEAIVKLQKSNITLRKEIPSLISQYQTRRDSTDGSMLAECSVARWCLDRAMTEQALVHTRRAEEIDSSSPIVAKLYRDLGFIQVEEKWVAEDEHLASTGKVRIGDRILTKEEAAAAKEQQMKAMANAGLEQEIRDAEWVIKSGEKKLAEATERRDKAKQEMGKADADNKGATNRKEQLQKRLQASAGHPQNDRTQKQNREDQAALQEAISEAARSVSAQKKCQKELENAEEALAKVKGSIAKAKAILPELIKQLEAASGKPAGDKNASEKTSEKPVDKASDQGAEGKPKSRFAVE